MDTPHPKVDRARTLRAAPIVVAVALAACGAVAVAQVNPVGQARIAPSEIEILSFDRVSEGGATTMMARVARPGAPAPDMPTISVAVGDSIVLRWRMRVRHASRLTARLTAGSQTIDLNPGTPHDDADGWKVYENQRSLLVREEGVYTLRVVGFPGGGSTSTAESSVRVVARSPELRLLEPQVDPATRRVTFRVRNDGEAEANGRWTVNYQIQRRNPMRELVTDSRTTGPSALARGATMELAQLVLPEDAWQGSQLWMRVRVDLMATAAIPGDARDFTYEWPTHELRIPSSRVSGIGTLLGGSVLIHNYQDPGGRDVLNSLPYEAGASEIVILGRSQPFTFERIRYEVAAVEHFFLVNRFRSLPAGPDFLTIENGKLCMRIGFECGREREIKGWTRNYIGKDYRDNTTPDININRMNLKVMLTPVLAGGRLTYRDVAVELDSDLSFPGGWDWLNFIRDLLNREVRRTLLAGFSDMLNDRTLKSTIETELNNLVATLGGATGIHDLVAVRGSGDQIIITYR